jgi:hypothetical protein
MPDERLRAAVEVLMEDLQEHLRKVSETKRMINSLSVRLGDEPPFPEDEEKSVSLGAGRPDAYYGKPFATAVQVFLQARRHACSAEEIMEALERGGFDFKATGWKTSDRLRMVALSLAKNNKVFHKLPNNTFGLLEWYPEIQKRQANAFKAGAAEGEDASPEEKQEGK